MTNLWRILWLKVLVVLGETLAPTPLDPHQRAWPKLLEALNRQLRETAAETKPSEWLPPWLKHPWLKARTAFVADLLWETKA